MTYPLPVGHRRLRLVPMLMRIVSLLVVATLFASCSRHRTYDPSETASLVFANESVNRVDVFVGVVTTNVAAVRLGSVMPGETRTFVVPPRVLQLGTSVNVYARRSGRSTYAESGPVLMRAGDEIGVTLPIGAAFLIVRTGV